MTNTYTEKGGSIQDRRHELGLSRQELAGRAACSMSYLALLEGGYEPQHSDVLARLLRVLEEVAAAS